MRRINPKSEARNPKQIRMKANSKFDTILRENPRPFSNIECLTKHRELFIAIGVSQNSGQAAHFRVFQADMMNCPFLRIPSPSISLPSKEVSVSSQKGFPPLRRSLNSPSGAMRTSPSCSLLVPLLRSFFVTRPRSLINQMPKATNNGVLGYRSNDKTLSVIREAKPGNRHNSPYLQTRI
jgi:hypothetical protein